MNKMDWIHDREGKLVMHISSEGAMIIGEAFKPRHMQSDRKTAEESIHRHPLREASYCSAYVQIPGMGE